MIYPAATWKPVQNHGGNMTAHLGLVLHVQQGNGGLQGWFNNPASQASSTWWVSKTGLVEQYVDSQQQAWAQAAGNSTYNSVETEGYDTESLTQPQINALSALYTWGHSVYGWPYVLSDVVGSPGFAWHGMGGVPWGNHPGCPGTIRRNQRSIILQTASPSPPNLGDENVTSFIDGTQYHVFAYRSDGGMEHWWFDKSAAASGWHHEVIPG